MKDKELVHLRTKLNYLGKLIDACNCPTQILSEIEKSLMMKFFISEEEFENCARIQKLP